MGEPIFHIGINEYVVFAENPVVFAALNKIANHVKMAIHARPAFLGMTNESASSNSWVLNAGAAVDNKFCGGESSGLKSGNHRGASL
jgi:hypothetical protein